jgi:hypothetical protein
MSIEMPHPIRLFVDSRNMFVRLGGMPRKLDSAPMIEGLPRYTMLDYVPQLIAEIQPFASGRRDLSPWERECVLIWMLQAKGNW